MDHRAPLLRQLLEDRIPVLDGAMGTMIQKERLSEVQFRGQRFRGWGREATDNSCGAVRRGADRFAYPLMYIAGPGDDTLEVSTAYAIRYGFNLGDGQDTNDWGNR